MSRPGEITGASSRGSAVAEEREADDIAFLRAADNGASNGL